jgi:hypothetical protein
MGSPCVGKVNSKLATISLVSTFRQQFLLAMVGESPNKHLSLIPVQKKRAFKPALKLAKIGTLRALGDQDSSPKNFKCG